GVVGVTLVDPLFHLGGDVDGLWAVDVGAHAILENLLMALLFFQKTIFTPLYGLNSNCGPLCGSRYIATVLSTLWNERNLVLRVEH
ncbi:MAG: hypothetical protein WBJ49_01170, partial [Limnochordia bacterium]